MHDFIIFLFNTLVGCFDWLNTFYIYGGISIFNLLIIFLIFILPPRNFKVKINIRNIISRLNIEIPP